MKTRAPWWLLAALVLPASAVVGAAQGDKAAVALDTPITCFVSTQGNDLWSGRKAVPSKGSEGPFATVHRALAAVREARSVQGVPQPATIYIKEGTYYLHKPIELTPEDSHLQIRAGQKESPILSGGRLIAGWRKSKAASKQGRSVWVADLPEAARGRWEFVELWTNGKPATRARFPNRGYLSVGELPDKTAQWTDGHFRFRVQKGDLDALEDLAGADAMVMTRWVESRLPVLGFEKADGVIRLSKRSVFQLSPGDLYYLEGGLEMLDEPGEWCLDGRQGKLFYVPREGERLDTLQAVAPVLSRILILKGRPEQGAYIRNVEFENLTFSHSEWNFPGGFDQESTRPNVWPPPEKEVGGFAQAAIGVPGAVWGEGVRNSVFTKCRFQNLGGYGMELARGCSSNTIQQCEFMNLGAGGIRLGETVLRSDPREHSRGNVIRDCAIHHGGRMFHSAIGIWIGQSPDNEVTHNLIHDFYYTGISVGWTWGYGPTLATNNLVAFNHVHHIGVQSDGDGPILSDMGGIYTLGMQPGTRIVNNLWHDIAGFRYGGWGIYLDEGSSSILAESNVVYRTTHGGFHQHYGATNVVQNNVFAFARDHQVQRSRPETHSSFRFQKNIVLFDSGVLFGGTWSGGCELNQNVYWDLRGKEVPFPGTTLEKWRAEGRDVHSLIVDPEFIAAGKNDFRLKTSSPALKLGFKPINLDSVGPRDIPSGRP
ncbi:MAG TPA: right-handed parallel beta-helix repeat-containing protein [Clostridia bacterium]|nr:right-handed parallel beta-helix repeat-containing protein [Clostridia bacterium]